MYGPRYVQLVIQPELTSHVKTGRADLRRAITTFVVFVCIAPQTGPQT